MIELTAQQLELLKTQEGVPARMVDPRTGGVYVLLRVDVYERLSSLLDDLDPADTYAAVDEALAPGWNYPGMEDYDRYEELRPRK